MGSNPSVSAKNFQHLACLDKSENAVLLLIAATVLGAKRINGPRFPLSRFSVVLMPTAAPRTRPRRTKQNGDPRSDPKAAASAPT